MKPLNSFFSQTFYYGFSTVLARVLNFLLVPLYTSIFSTEQYGIVTEMYAYTAFIMILSTLGMETAFFRFINKEENKQQVYSTTAGILFISSIIALIFGQIFSDVASSLLAGEHQSIIKYSNYIIWIFLIVALDTLCVLPFAKLRQEEKAKKFAIIKAVNIILNIFFNIFFLVICPYLLELNQLTPELTTFDWVRTLYSPEIGIGYIFISNLLSSILTLLILSKDVYELLKLNSFNFLLAKKMLKYSFPLIIAGLAYVTNEVVDKILIKLLLPSETALGELGIYAACYKMSIFMILFVQSYRFAAEPFFFNYQHKENSKKIYAQIMKFFIIAGLFIFLLVSLNKEIIVNIFLLNKDFHEGKNVIPILLIGHLFLGVYYNLSLWYKLTNKTKFGALISLGGSVITLSLNFLLIPKIGYMGSAWATFFCYFVMAITSYILSRKYYFIPYEKIKITVYFFVAIIIYMCANYFEIKKLGYNLMLIALYLCVVFLCEKLKFKKINEKN